MSFSFAVDLYGCIRLFVSYLSDTDNIVPFENTTPINLINVLRVLSVWPLLVWLIGVVLSNSTKLQLSVSDKYEAINERTRTEQQNESTHSMGVPEVPMN